MKLTEAPVDQFVKITNIKSSQAAYNTGSIEGSTVKVTCKLIYGASGHVDAVGCIACGQEIVISSWLTDQIDVELI